MKDTVRHADVQVIGQQVIEVQWNFIKTFLGFFQIMNIVCAEATSTNGFKRDKISRFLSIIFG